MRDKPIFMRRRRRFGHKAVLTTLGMAIIVAGALALSRVPDPAQAGPVFAGTGLAEPAEIE